MRGEEGNLLAYSDSQVLGEQTLKLPKLIPSQAEISATAVGGEAAVPEIAPTDRSMATTDHHLFELADE